MYLLAYSPAYFDMYFSYPPAAPEPYCEAFAPNLPGPLRFRVSFKGPAGTV